MYAALGEAAAQGAATAAFNPFRVPDAKLTSSASAEKRGKAVRFAMHNPDASEHSVGFSVLF